MTEPARVFNLSIDEEAGLTEAVAAVRAGSCIVLPTDTVYGIGANAFDTAAVQGLLDAKERGRDMPPPVLIAEPSMLRAIADEVPEGAAALAKALWPGALTLVLKAQAKSGMDLGETHGTIAVRVPDHEGARTLLRRTGPLAVSSANVSGQPAGLTCEETLAQLGDRVAVYLDGGPVGGGVASTIVDFAATDEGKVLRLGAIPLETLREHAPSVVGLDEPKDEAEETSDADAETVAVEQGEGTESKTENQSEEEKVADPAPDVAETSEADTPVTETTGTEATDTEATEAEAPDATTDRIDGA